MGVQALLGRVIPRFPGIPGASAACSQAGVAPPVSLHGAVKQGDGECLLPALSAGEQQPGYVDE